MIRIHYIKQLLCRDENSLYKATTLSCPVVIGEDGIQFLDKFHHRFQFIKIKYIKHGVSCNVFILFTDKVVTKK